MLRVLASAGDSNLLLSPYSMAVAMAIVYEGADLGMKTAFDDPEKSADFDRMAPRRLPDATCS